MSLSPVVLVLLLATAAVVAHGNLVEWPVHLFEAANANKNVDCKGVELMEPPGHYAGYFKLNNTQDGHLSYMYFENRFKDPDAPLVFWTNGGPGCSSYFGLFLENGPYDIREDLSLCWKSNGWDIGHNIIFVEQPVNVGFSYSRAAADRVLTDERVGVHMVSFFQAFLEKHQELANKDLYITGESYAGHYLPHIAKSIMTFNEKSTDSNPLRLKGVLLINPWISPAATYYSYPFYAFQEKLVGKDTRDKMLSAWDVCDQALKACEAKVPILRGFICNSAYSYCQMRLFEPVLFLHPKLNYYDIRRRDCTGDICYDNTQLERFLNVPEVKATLGVKSSIRWKGCSRSIRREMGWEVATDASEVIASIVNAGLNFSVVVGDRDYICNYIGSERWTDHLKWDKEGDWAKTKQQAIQTSNGEAYVRQVTPLSFVKVREAGHMVPMDQPALGLEILTTFTRGKTYPTKADTQTFGEGRARRPIT